MMAICSAKLSTLALHSHAKTHLGFRPSYVPLTPIKKFEFPLVMSADSVSGVAAPEALTSDEGTLGSNGSPPPSVAAVEEVWVGGTWYLKQFEKDGKTLWDSVIDAEVKWWKWQEDSPQSSSNEDPIFYLPGLVISFIMASGGGVFKPVFLALLLAQLINFTECVREPSKYASRPPLIASDKPSMFPPLSPLRTATDERSMFPQLSPPRTATDERSMFPPLSPPRTATDERSVCPRTATDERSMFPPLSPPRTATDERSMSLQLSPPRTATDERSMSPQLSPPRTASDEWSMFPPPSPPRTASDERSVFSTTVRMERPSRPRLRSCLPDC